MVLSYNSCIISIENGLIECSYPDRFGETKWKMVLNDRDICFFTDKKKERSFKIDEILEFQFEMGNGGGRNQDLPACIAYVIFKVDTDPKDFFYFFICEEYVLLNQTKAYDFGSKILSHISQRYDIPAIYKLSIDTKKKRKAIAMVPLLLIIIFILIWLRLRFG